ncbi:MAG: NUDIX pyrophosphatase [Melioribacteraceae bacterium]|nr:NUDIX pyrophosphatase [Melioribacteraceae bacterium]MCF8355198.1 NUDIX pyrophosphatase [Melioribacteraceae bacterium]MCF8396184.1 NUDIX pyrophosphatase [Melioribacteraceae bacterium]MCF8419883.1 NUDIX pyrophosphatase [Melioribacteraceae bacterium]
MDVISNLIEAHIIRLRNDELEFLLLRRSAHEKYADIWQMVTGSTDGDEKAYETALREIKEETNLLPQKFWVVPHMNSFYSHERNYVCMVPVFVCLVDENDIVKISDEHDEYKWVDKTAAKKLLAWQGQRQSVDIIYEYFMFEKSLLNFVEIKL